MEYYSINIKNKNFKRPCDCEIEYNGFFFSRQNKLEHKDGFWKCKDFCIILS